jgi:hypothetical protein
MNNSFLIPEKFKLNKKTVVVIVDDEYLKDYKFWGEADFTEGMIILCHRDWKGRVLKKTDKEKTFYHELVHQILHSMNHKLKWDEDFVEAFSDRLYEFEKTKQ